MSRSVAVLWEDAHGLAVAKPAGMLTQGSGEPTVEALVRAYLAPDDPASVYLGTVHRLDRPVSGVILWAKTPKAARRWADQFASREVKKEYWAIVEGEVAPGEDSGLWSDGLTRPDAMGRAGVVDLGTTGAQQAITWFEIGRGGVLPSGLTWIKLRPETGRTHQLRAQSAARGLPILGDSTYGSTRPFPQGIALHARSLTVEHPSRKELMTIEAPLPASWSLWLPLRS